MYRDFTVAVGSAVIELEYQCADFRFVEFTAERLNARSEGMCSRYNLDRIIVCTLEASLRGE